MPYQLAPGRKTVEARKHKMGTKRNGMKNIITFWRIRYRFYKEVAIFWWMVFSGQCTPDEYWEVMDRVYKAEYRWRTSLKYKKGRWK